MSKIDEWTDSLQSHPSHLLQNIAKPTTTVLNYLQSIETDGPINPGEKCTDTSNEGISHTGTKVHISE